MKPEKDVWADKVRQLRKQLNLSQEDLACKLQTNQCTISRWERGVTTPSFRMRSKLEALGCPLTTAEKTDLDVVAETAQVLFDCSRLPALLLHRDGTIMAVSSDNEYHPGLKYQTGVKLRDQTFPEDMEPVIRLEQFFEAVDFWNSVNECFDFPYQTRGEDRCVTLTSVVINNETYCLMKKKPV